MKYLIDCGTHFGEGLDYIINTYGVDNKWKVFSFEANPYTYEKCIKKYDFVEYYNLACSTYDGKVILKVQDTSTYEGYEFHPKNTGEGSTIIEEEFHHEIWASSFKENILIDCIDLCSFISNIKDSEYMILKMDIEGSEYSILKKMNEFDLFKRLNHLIIEFHPWAFNKKLNEYIEMKKYFIEKLTENNVKVEIYV